MNTVCPKCGLLPSPGRLAFHHRHVALSYVRRNAPDLHSEACSHACAETERHGLTFDDYVARLEGAVRRHLAARDAYDAYLEDPFMSPADGAPIVHEWREAEAALRAMVGEEPRDA